MDEASEKRTAMGAERLAELLGASLDLMDGGMVVLDEQERVVFWNEAATRISGYAREALLGKPCPEGFYRMDAQHLGELQAHAESQVPLHGHFVTSQVSLYSGESPKAAQPVRPALVELRHRQGHTLPAMLRRLPLRDAFGGRFGTLLRFHPVEDADRLPHGETGEGVGVEHSQADMEDRLDEAWREWSANAVPFGLLWIMVDQGAKLRKTHGRDACEAMLQVVETTLKHGLKPTEILGRWGDAEFLVLSHERTAEMLFAHAQQLAGLARTADFRWWGDRVSLTVSVGVAIAAGSERLSGLLGTAQKAMQGSIFAGGNRVTGDPNPRGRECSQS
jgi:diguanylate cyclase (GGDEF)-like protein/PAS domain S-box-containing protein